MATKSTETSNSPNGAKTRDKNPASPHIFIFLIFNNTCPDLHVTAMTCESSAVNLREGKGTVDDAFCNARDAGLNAGDGLPSDVAFCNSCF